MLVLLSGQLADPLPLFPDTESAVAPGADQVPDTEAAVALGAAHEPDAFTGATGAAGVVLTLKVDDDHGSA